MKTNRVERLERLTFRPKTRSGTFRDKRPYIYFLGQKFKKNSVRGSQGTSNKNKNKKKYNF